MARDTETVKEVVESQVMDASKDAAPPKTGPKGIRAIQGKPEPPEAAPPETPARADQISAEAAQQGARRAAEQALVDKGDTADKLLDARRHASEAAARATLGGDATNLDDAVKGLGLKGDTFPTYDLTSSAGVASVKTHWGMDGSLNDSARGTYQREFRKMLGWGREVGALKQDGHNIITVRDSGVPVPDSLRQAAPELAGQYLRDRSLFMIPDDHVASVKADLRAKLLDLPGNYFLPPNPSEEQVMSVLDRVRGIGLSSQELQDIIGRLGN